MQFAVRLVRKTVDSLLRKGVPPPLPETLPEELKSIRTGIFITVFENPGRKPRARMGALLPSRPTLAEEILFQTTRLLAAFPLRKEDLPYLTYELVLTDPPSLLPTLVTLRAEDGLLVRTSSGKTGFSLPGARPRSTAERFAEACAQGSIRPALEDTRLYVFGVQTFAEVP